MAIRYFTNHEISWAMDLGSQLSDRKFKSLFLYDVGQVSALWSITQRRMQNKGNIAFTCPEVMLWALYYLKVYPTWDQMALTTGVLTEKTLRKWIAIVIEYLSEIDSWVRTTVHVKMTSQHYTFTLISFSNIMSASSCRSIGITD
jgi:hypothetical protein